MKHVLVIGDDPAIVTLLRLRLHAEDLEVTGTQDLAEGKRRALADDVSLVILDRVVCGGELVGVLMGFRHRKPELSVIVLNDRADVADRIEAFDAGATDVVAKPFSTGELAARVVAHLRRAAWK